MASMSELRGHRGYIGSRPYFGQQVPQHVQNLVIRDFCARNGFSYLLSATEYAMPGCYMILEDVIRETRDIDGIVLFSCLMLPLQRERRLDMVSRIMDSGVTLHGAVEDIHVRHQDDVERLETLIALRISTNYLSASR
jgi:sporadic carbohydrate cluster protein (TIGR04323 family)